MDPGGLADQEPFTAWLRRGVGRDRIFAEPKLYEPLGTAALIREPSRQRFALSRAIIELSVKLYSERRANAPRHAFLFVKCGSNRIKSAFASALATRSASPTRQCLSLNVDSSSLARHALMQDTKLIRQFRPSAGHTKEVGT